MIGELRRNARVLSATLAVVSAIGLLAAVDAATGSEHPLPHALVLLEKKMERLEIHSERWEQAWRVRSVGESSGETCQHGRCSRHVSKVPVSQSARLMGIGAESPPEGELFNVGQKGRSGYIQSGANVYIWAPSACAPGRPWVTSPSSEHNLPPVLDPFAGEKGSRSPYAQLIAALAGSKVIDLGRRTVSGRPVTAFLAVRSVPPHERPLGFIANAHPKRVSERLEVFITSEGLPLRVVARQGSAREGIDVDTKVLAVNLPEPLGIQAPGAGETRPESKESCAPESSAK